MTHVLVIGRQVSRLSRRQTDRYMVGIIGPANGQFVGKEACKLVSKEAGNLIGFVFIGPAAGKFVVRQPINLVL